MDKLYSVTYAICDGLGDEGEVWEKTYDRWAENTVEIREEFEDLRDSGRIESITSIKVIGHR